jgi:hypothetical protein
VRLTGSLPLAFMTKISPPLRYVIFVLSGDHAGIPSSTPRLFVRFSSSLPSAFMVKTSPYAIESSRVVVKAIFCPSGDQAG